MAEMVTGGIGPLAHYEISNVHFEDPPEKDWEKKWNQLKQYLINYKIEKSGMINYQKDVFGRYCITLSIDEIFDKMCEIEKM